MGLKFNGKELSEIGIQIEVNGKAFYAEAEKNAKTPESRKLFGELKLQEENHITAFKKIGEIEEAGGEPESYEGEFADYVKMFAGQNVFSQQNRGAEAAKNAKSDAEVIELALGFEKESILLYESMKSVVSSSSLKALQALINEELKHVKYLLDLKSKFSRL
ncbi:MAG: hypothetical protein WCI43_00915 [Candidatus Firestonebacteria bacterium]